MLNAKSKYDQNARVIHLYLQYIRESLLSTEELTKIINEISTLQQRNDYLNSIIINHQPIEIEYITIEIESKLNDKSN